VARVTFEQLVNAMTAALVREGAPQARARRCAELIAGNDRDGVISHGVRRFPLLLKYIQAGNVDIRAEPCKVAAFGSIEQWDGRLGLGPVNAETFMQRAIEIARDNGIGCVAARNTSHWHRGGTFGLQAAMAGCIGICWTNAIALMPPYGSAQVKLGNNPLVLAVPRGDAPLLLDMAMTQYSSGRLGIHKQRGEPLAVPGGYDEAGNLTTSADAIRASKRPLPIGYWKGSGLALLLDAAASLLSGGRTTAQISEQSDEIGVSQVFIAMDVSSFADESVVDAIVRDFLETEPLDPDQPVRYPGAKMLEARARTDRDGIEVDDSIWNHLQ